MEKGSIVVLGGSGFVGRSIVARLAARGHRVVVPTRRREPAKKLILLPTVDVIEANVHDLPTLAGLLDGAAAVINLVGILNEGAGSTFASAHSGLAGTVVAACRKSGVSRLIHMSALHADPAGPSAYQRSKGEAEAVVAASGLRWTIIRPSVIFGRDDSFLNLFARLVRVLPVVALAGAGARFAPVHVGDVAHCFVQAVDDDLTQHARYDLCGPKVYTLAELVRYVGELSGAVRPIVPLGPRFSRLQATMLEFLPGRLMSRDNLLSMQRDSVCSGPFPAVFGITPSALEAIAPEYIPPAAMKSPYDGFRAGGGR